jgi:hypothetical protein
MELIQQQRTNTLQLAARRDISARGFAQSSSTAAQQLQIAADSTRQLTCMHATS